MISSAVWCKYARVNFSKTTKLHEPVEKSRQTTFESMRALFEICTRATTLYSCYMKINSFSADQKRVIFACSFSARVWSSR